MMKRFFLLAAILGFTFSAEANPVSLIEKIKSDQPEDWWRFEDEKSLTGKQGKVALGKGPGGGESKTIPEGNKALHLKGDGGHIRIPDAEKYRFTNGDSITIEAWVKPNGGRSGFSYIIGKGRTTTKKENQNWALRLDGKTGSYQLSFLFRSADGTDGKKHKSDYHRWTSNASFAPTRNWHHVAVAYTFGKPDSIFSVIDGKVSKGKWDMGGATTQAPVVDDAEVWIGSARDAAPGSSFSGGMDELALYRKIIPVETLTKRYEKIVSKPVPLQFTKVGADQVLAEIRTGIGNPREWPDLGAAAEEFLGRPAFALTDLPHRYNEHGARIDRPTPLHVRMAAKVKLPAGKLKFLLRSPGLSQLSIDDKPVANVKYFRVSGSAHGKLREMPETPPNYPRHRMGTEEVIGEYTSDGKEHVITVESNVGDPGWRLDIGELLLAFQKEGETNWNLVPAPGGKPIPFDDVGFVKYQQAEADDFLALNTERRRAAAEETTAYWATRHDQAKKHVASLEPIAIPKNTSPQKAIDAFLNAKIASNNANAADPKGAEHAQVIGLLEEHCYRCHGEKAKGGLKLNSRNAALAEADSGYPAVVPGNPDESELIYRITTDDEDEIMPPKGDGFTKDQIALTKKWIADGAPWTKQTGKVTVPKPLDDLSFLRRIYLDTLGVLPTAEECRAFLAADEKTRVAALVDRLLADPRHADHWVPYWQDVLAENPRLVKPVLNNTGPFRFWLHEAMLDNKPMDQFVTDLVNFQGSTNGGGAAGFSRAAENDAPMAAKAHIIGTAFLGIEMKCARCHDSPFHESTQKDLFSIAAMLEKKPVSVPPSSTVPATFFSKQKDSARKSLITVSLNPKTPVQPEWPFQEISSGSGGPGKEKMDLAWEITRPDNPRFAKVLVSRVWKRYFGEGFVEPVFDWEGNAPSHPELLDFLARDFVSSGYDLRHLSRMILNSEAYRRSPRLELTGSADARFFEAPLRRRVSAEQLVDSLFSASGIPFYSEELTFDVEAVHTAKTFLNMGFPTRAWQMISLSSDRDRPSLTLPKAQSITAVMEINGWRPNRSEPVTTRKNDPGVLQPGMLGNGLMGIWLTRLSDYSDLTKMAIEAESVEKLIDDLYLQFLTRNPNEAEKAELVNVLGPGFENRLTSFETNFEKATWVPEVREISWSNHLNAEANQLAARIEAKSNQGPPATSWIDPDWRSRMEDVVWALVNSPEMQFVP